MTGVLDKGQFDAISSLLRLQEASHSQQIHESIGRFDIFIAVAMISVAIARKYTLRGRWWMLRCQQNYTFRAHLLAAHKTLYVGAYALWLLYVVDTKTHNNKSVFVSYLAS